MKAFRPGEGRIAHILHNNPMPEKLDQPRVHELLLLMGTNIKLARLRRHMAARDVCKRVGISRSTLWGVEKGAPEVAIGAYARVLFILRLENEISKWGVDDGLGQRIRDEELLMKKRGPYVKIPASWH